jgi:hydroxyacylglutathione hydrolase
MIDVVRIETPTLGDRSYLVHDGEVGLVVDPQRDIDRITALAARLGVRITHVAETHMHNDYVSGGLALSRACGASYLVAAAEPAGFARTPVSDGDSIDVSDAFRIRVAATPGHTFNHLAYVLETAGAAAGVFTGGSLLFGSTGRTDLLGADHAAALARAQHASARRLARELPDSAEVFPTHGFGSFCAATQAAAQSSTIGQEKLANHALTLDEEAYVEALLAGLDAWPAYYAQMGAINLAGAAAPDLTPPQPASAAQLRRLIDAGEWVVDLRDRVAFAAGFLPGSVSFPLDGSLATYLGWLLPHGTPVTLLGETPEQVARAQRELVRIGIDRPAAAATGTPGEWAAGQPLASLRLALFSDLAAAMDRSDGTVPVVLDVRRRLEWEAGHIEGAVHIPLHDLPRRLDEIPPGQVWVHCRTGYRSTVAASLLAACGRDAISIDDEIGNAVTAGLPVVSSQPEEARG